MDSSPRPQRRFSKWQTTKRTFVIGGVVYKPSNGHVLQEDNKKSETMKGKVKQINNEKNGKIHKKSFLNHSTTDSIPKQTRKSSASLAKLSVNRQLYFEAGAGTQGKCDADVVDKAVPPEQKALADVPPLDDESADSHDEASQSSKSSHSSQTKVQVSPVSAAESSNEVGVETNSRKRQATDDEESSDNSSTDKENKDKDTGDTDLPSPAKKPKRTLQNLSTSTKINISKRAINHTQENDEALSARQSTLRNRGLLSLTKTLVQKRQYPLNVTSEKKSIASDRSTSKVKEKAPAETLASTSKKTAEKRQAEMKSRQSSVIKTPPKKLVSQDLIKTSHKKPAKQNQTKDRGVGISDRELEKQSVLSQKAKAFNNSDTTKISRISPVFGSSPVNKHSCSIDSRETDSESRRGGLRDRRLLPTSEDMQQSRQYPVAFLSPRKRKSLEDSIVLSGKVHESTAYRKQKELTNSRTPASRTDGSESASSSRDRSRENQLTGKKSGFSKNGLLAQRDFSLNIPESSQEFFQQTGAEKISLNTEIPTRSICSKSSRVLKKIEDGGDKKDRGAPPSVKSPLKKCYPRRVENHASKISSNNSSRERMQYNSDNGSSQEFMQSRDRIGKRAENVNIQQKKDNVRLSELSKKSSPSKIMGNRQYSLPRRPSKINLAWQTDEASAEGSSSVADPSEFATVVDISWENPEKMAQKKPPRRDVPSQGQKELADTRPTGSFDETRVAHPKRPRKRKLTKELEKCDVQAASSKAEGQKVMLWCEDGKPRRGSDVNAFDLILQTVVEAEDQLLDETQDDALRYKVVKKVMRNFKKAIKPMISKVNEVKSLQHNIRQLNSRCRKLIDDIKEQKQKKSRLQTEMQTRSGSCKDMDLFRVNEWMKGYAELLQNFARRPR